MSDLIIDLRPLEAREAAAAASESALRFVQPVSVQRIRRAAFDVTVARTDGMQWWGPSVSATPAGSELVVVLAGRIFLEESEWDATLAESGDGGRASRWVASRYREHGVKALEGLNGNFALFLYDAAQEQAFLVTDRAGMTLVYAREPRSDATRVFSTHPDVAARCVGEEQDWDLMSLTEFVMAGKVTYPQTYYAKIRAMPTGSVVRFDLRDGRIQEEAGRRYFDFRFCPDGGRVSEWELAEELAGVFRRAVRRRTHPRFGKTALGLSGGLDSRAILSAMERRDHVLAFTLLDSENDEVRIARRIARTAGVPLATFKRDFDYYGSAAALGVRISGGMGCLASNHFLGIRDRLAAEGATNLITGCYCDYILKGLALNTRERRWTRQEELAAFRFQFYRPHYSVESPFRAEVEGRWAALFPEAKLGHWNPEDWFDVERKRTFPLAYEGDSAQRVIPQRVMPWSLPIVDNEVLDFYGRIPWKYKLNASLFQKMLIRLCPREICRIPNNNTGAPVNAPVFQFAVQRYLSALRNRVSEKFFPKMATRGSWPNWGYYLGNSTLIGDLWNRGSRLPREVFGKILGENPYGRPLAEYRDGRVEYFLRLLTLKLWLEQRETR